MKIWLTKSFLENSRPTHFRKFVRKPIIGVKLRNLETKIIFLECEKQRAKRRICGNNKKNILLVQKTGYKCLVPNYSARFCSICIFITNFRVQNASDRTGVNFFPSYPFFVPKFFFLQNKKRVCDTCTNLYQHFGTRKILYIKLGNYVRPVGTARSILEIGNFKFQIA